MIVNILIFVIGLVIYAGSGIAGLLFLLGATAVSYVLGLLIPKHRWLLWPGVGILAALLLIVKLQPITNFSLISALGISYFSLQIISYLADVYKGRYEPERNLFRYAFFVTYYPHLLIGPIERYDSMSLALKERRITWEGIFDGGARALWGGFKKLIIASRLGVIISAISADTAAYSGAWALAAMVMYSIQLYCDFSGGIDMVLGISRMLGLRLSENFDAPYLSQSFQEFWRRWHMTLGAWLRQYVYIPLGGNRKGKVRKVINLIVTFLVSGIWHGIEYLIWGLINGIFVACGTRFQTKWKNLNRAVTFLLVSLLWSFFIWPDALTACKMMLSVFTTFNYGAFFAGIGAMGLTMGDWIVLAVAVVILWVYDVKAASVKERFAKLCPAGKTAVICILALAVLLFGMYGIGFNADEFIYSRF